MPSPVSVTTNSTPARMSLAAEVVTAEPAAELEVAAAGTPMRASLVALAAAEPVAGAKPGMAAAVAVATTPEGAPVLAEPDVTAVSPVTTAGRTGVAEPLADAAVGA